MATRTAAARPEPVIETAPIRLTQDETKLILRITMAGKPIPACYGCESLSDMGILRRIAIPEEEVTARRIADCWKRIRAGLAKKNQEAIHQACHDMERLTRDRDRNNPSYVVELTDLGKQVARGITVRLNGQYGGTRR